MDIQGVPKKCPPLEITIFVVKPALLYLSAILRHTNYYNRWISKGGHFSGHPCSYRGYYTAARRYEVYLRGVKTIFMNERSE